MSAKILQEQNLYFLMAMVFAQGKIMCVGFIITTPPFAFCEAAWKECYKEIWQERNIILILVVFLVKKVLLISGA